MSGGRHAMLHFTGFVVVVVFFMFTLFLVSFYVLFVVCNTFPCLILCFLFWSYLSGVFVCLRVVLNIVAWFD
jgi:hypothetical protein